LTTKDEDVIAAEADARLDEFFSEDEWQADGDEASTDSDDDSGIKELKALILSLDWEITDQIMDKLKSELDKLKVQWEGDPVLITFLSLLGNLGKYISKKKAESHPDSVTLLQDSYKDLERVLNMKGMDAESKKQIVMADVNRFKKLQQEIAAGKTGTAPQPAADKTPEQALEPEPEQVSEPEQALEPEPEQVSEPEQALEPEPEQAPEPKPSKVGVAYETSATEAPGGEALPESAAAAESIKDNQALVSVLERVITSINELNDTILSQSAVLLAQIKADKDD